MEKTQNKIITVSFVIAAVLLGYVLSVIMNVLTNTWGAFARISSQPWIAHGAPVAFGVICFAYMLLSPKIRNWAGEVVLEISKVVWPSVKDTRALTIVVCFIVLIAALIFWFFDIVSSQLIQFILDIEF